MPSLTGGDTSPERWALTQQDFVQLPRWIMDGDPGPYDVIGVRLQAADTVIVLDVESPEPWGVLHEVAAQLPVEEPSRCGR